MPQPPARTIATTGDTQTQPLLAGGPLLKAISTSIVSVLRDRYGRGPMNAKAYARDDVIVVVVRGSGFTALEQTIMDSEEPDPADRVIKLRREFQGWMTKRYTEIIEELTGRTVLAFLSQAHIEPDITIGTFFIDAPLDGFEAPPLKVCRDLPDQDQTHGYPAGNVRQLEPNGARCDG